MCAYFRAREIVCLRMHVYIFYVAFILDMSIERMLIGLLRERNTFHYFSCNDNDYRRYHHFISFFKFWAPALLSCFLPIAPLAGIPDSVGHGGFQPTADLIRWNIHNTHATYSIKSSLFLLLIYLSCSFSGVCMSTAIKSNCVTEFLIMKKYKLLLFL